jgi:hypothetical protein
LSYDTFERLVKYVNENNISLMSYFKKFDRDGTGNLDKNEFEGKYYDKEIKIAVINSNSSSSSSCSSSGSSSSNFNYNNNNNNVTVASSSGTNQIAKSNSNRNSTSCGNNVNNGGGSSGSSNSINNSVLITTASNANAITTAPADDGATVYIPDYETFDQYLNCDVEDFERLRISIPPQATAIVIQALQISSLVIGPDNAPGFLKELVSGRFNGL